MITPHIEIGKVYDGEILAHVNVSTFEHCLEHLEYPFTDRGPTSLVRREDTTYSIYGVVGRMVISQAGGCFLNIVEPPISRTLIGYVSEEVLREHLPNVYGFIKNRDRPLKEGVC